LTERCPNTARIEAAPLRNLKSVTSNGVTLHYTEEGDGHPILFVHGGLDDYRYWLPFMSIRRYRGVTYSRRYNYPNENWESLSDYSALVDVVDLEGLLGQLALSKVTLVGESYGALVALLYAMRRQSSVEAVVLCEPPIMGWLESLPGGRESWKDFESRLWKPFKAAIRLGDRRAAVKNAITFFTGPGMPDTLPREAVQDALMNSREWEVLTASSNPFPAIDSAKVESLRVRALVMTGQRTLPLHLSIDNELARHLRESQTVVIPNASHDMWRDNPSACKAALMAFLG
jgi:pimeloyl-ACP methyl ester carboxylesterase